MPGDNGSTAAAVMPEKSMCLSKKNDDKDTVPVRPPKRVAGLVLDDIDDRQKENLSSDTENSSPAIGPKDISCVRSILNCYVKKNRFQIV